MANPQNPGPKFGSPEWQRAIDAEVASRPTTLKVPFRHGTREWLEWRKALTNGDGLTIKFLVDVQGYSAGQVVTLANPGARDYILSGQASLQV